MSKADDRLEADLVAHAYSLQPVAIAGNGLAALMMLVIAVEHGWSPRLTLWCALHGGGTIAALAIYYTYRRTRLSARPALARWVLRSTALGTGLVWAITALWWPLSRGDAGLGALLCIAGLAAAGSSAWAADPAGLLLFTGPASAAHILTPESGSWLPPLLAVYAAAVTYISWRNHGVLTTALRLHFSNALLLEEAVKDRERAEAAQRSAERAAHAKTRFLAAASHDLRQPVQALALFSDVLRLDEDPARHANAVLAVGRTSQALSAMLESLLDLSRLDAAVVPNTPRAVELRTLLEDTVSALTQEAELHDVVLQVAGPSLVVFADPTLLARVVQNLAANAVRHGQRGRVLLSARRRGSHCLLQVWDQGAGIAAEDQERIFEEFVQLANPERDRRRGLGLGLSMVKRICSLCEWPLKLTSREGRGTVVSVRVPLAHEAERDSREPAPRGSRVLSVLLVEDDVTVREALEAWLRGQGCAVHAFSEAAPALDTARMLAERGTPVDVVVTDHGLPGGMSGSVLVERLRERFSTLPVVVLTGTTATLAGRLPERVTLLRKPASGREIWDAMRQLMGS